MQVQSQTSGTILEVRNLKKYYPISRGLLSRFKDRNQKQGMFVRAVDDISFSIGESEIFSLVGESGCGKTTTAKMIVALIKPTSGSISFLGKEIATTKAREMKDLRRDIQMVFQDPYSSLDPRMTVGRIISEPLRSFGYSRQERAHKVRDLLNDVGLKSDNALKHPKEFSGGQRQRIGIARALALGPKLIVADEPVSALDVSVRAQILNILLDLREKKGISFLVIAHDLSIVRHIADRVAVMHLGKIVELSDNHGFFENTLHPYSQALLDAIPIPDPSIHRKSTVIRGELPDPTNPPAGCRFHTRCPRIFDPCEKIEPELVEYAKGHSVACHLWVDPITKQVKDYVST